MSFKRAFPLFFKVENFSLVDLHKRLKSFSKTELEKALKTTGFQFLLASLFKNKFIIDIKEVDQTIEELKKQYISSLLTNKKATKESVAEVALITNKDSLHFHFMQLNEKEVKKLEEKAFHDQKNFLALMNYILINNSSKFIKNITSSYDIKKANYDNVIYNNQSVNDSVGVDYEIFSKDNFSIDDTNEFLEVIHDVLKNNLLIPQNNITCYLSKEGYDLDDYSSIRYLEEEQYRYNGYFATLNFILDHDFFEIKVSKEQNKDLTLEVKENQIVKTFKTIKTFNFTLH